MDRRTFLRTSAGAAGAVLLGSCTRPGGGSSEQAAPGGRPTLRLPGHDYGPPNPFGYLPPGYLFVSYVYDSLLWHQPAGKVGPWLAASHERSADGLVHTLKIRDDATWHDGQPLTAADVVFTFDYHRTNKDKIPGYVLFRPKNVVDVRESGGSVQIRLDKPLVTFERFILGGMPIVPRHIWSTVDNPLNAQDPKLLIGSGGYRLKSYTGGQGAYLFEANDRHFLGKPHFKRLEFRPVGDEFSSLIAGDIDVAGFEVSAATDKTLQPIREREEFEVLDGPADFMVATYFNCGTKPFDDVKVRRACARAIDRKDIARRLYGTRATPGSTGYLPPDHPLSVKVNQYPFSRQAANRLLDEAGYRRGSNGVRVDSAGNPLRVKLTTVPPLAPAVELVRDALEAIGFEIEIDPVEFLVAVGRLSAGNYQMAVAFSGGIGGDPDIMRGVFSSREEKAFFSAQGYGDAELDDLAERQSLTFDEAERKRMVARMQQIVVRDVPILPLYYPTPFFIYRRSVFDDWSFRRGSGGPLNRQVLITGRSE